MKFFKKFLSFTFRLGFEAYHNELYYMGNELTYKIFLSIFPFLVFIISLISSLNIDTMTVLYTLQGALPPTVLNTLLDFIDIINEQNSSTGLISVSLGLTVVSTSSGVVAIMRGINRTYGITKKRRFIINRLISIFLVLVLVLCLITTFILIVFSDSIFLFLKNLDFVKALLPSSVLNYDGSFILDLAKYAISVVTVLFATMTIYNVSVIEKVPFKSTLPGSIFTMFFWMIASSIYNYYINTYSRYTSIYGNIGNLFILVFWINIIAIIILLGSQVNAILYNDSIIAKKSD